MLGLQVDLPARHRAVPLGVVVAIEDERLVGGCPGPGPGLHLGLELAGRPAGIAHGEEDPSRALALGDRVEDVRLERERDPVLDGERARAHELGRMEHEDPQHVDRPPGVEPDRGLDAPALDPRLLQQQRERDLAERSVHHQALSAARVVTDHVDDGARESRVLHLGGGDEELAGEAAGTGARLGGAARGRGDRGERDGDDDEDHRGAGNAAWSGAYRTRAEETWSNPARLRHAWKASTLTVYRTVAPQDNRRGGSTSDAMAGRTAGAGSPRLPPVLGRS